MKTIKETSSLTGVSEHHIRLLCKGNKIKYIRAGSKYLVNYERFLDYLNGES
jgi:excisionase family DNA binding protein